MSLYRPKFTNKISTGRPRTDYATLRDIPILDVARLLGIDVRRTGAGTHNMREENGLTSLVIFEKTNTWYRYSGKDHGGVTHGSPIDLVMHIRECSLRDAVLFLSSRYL